MSPIQLALNPRYASRLDNGTVRALYVPGGFWAVKVVPFREWGIAYVVPRAGNTADAFLLASGTFLPNVRAAAIDWRDSATTLCMRMDRFVYAGSGKAAEETFPDLNVETLVPLDLHQ